MTTATALGNEISYELASTLLLLERLPEDECGWKPHAKSMSLKELAMHIAEIPEWIDLTVNQDALDFGVAKFVHQDPKSNAEFEALDYEKRGSCFLYPSQSGWGQDMGSQPLLSPQWPDHSVFTVVRGCFTRFFWPLSRHKSNMVE